jgi:rod shape-determining protein MreB
MGFIRRRAAGRPRKARAARRKVVRKHAWKVVKVGLHFGDSKSRVAASKDGEPLRLKRDVFTNLIGFLRLQMPQVRLPKKTDVLCAEQAVKFLQQVDLKKPIHSGLVDDVRVCRQFVTHICSAIDPSGTKKLWGVASIPAMAGTEDLEKAHRGLHGPLHRVIIAPEPYLASEGMRLEPDFRLGPDFTRGALVIDVGAQTTDICLVRGGFPRPEDQIRLEIAGNSIDDRIFKNALVHSPALFLSRRLAREIKEEQAFVGGSPVDSEGSDLLALTDVIRKACDALLDAVVTAACTLLGRNQPEAAAAISRAIILTGGGSRIRNLSAVLERELHARGYPQARVHVPKDYQGLVTRGALRFAQKLSDEEWKAAAARTPAENARYFSLGGGADPAGASSDQASVPPVDMESIAWMDVGLRAEATTPEASLARARPEEPPRAPLPGPSAPVHEVVKKRDRKLLEVDMEELDFFRAL